MFGLGMQELIVILVIVLVIFGARRIPQLMKGIGTGVKEFKQAIKDDDGSAQSETSKTEEKCKASENSESDS